MTLVGLLGVLMVSTLRFSSFKTVGTRSRSMRTIILAVGIGMFIFLYPRYVLLAMVIGYILNGLLRFVWTLRRRPNIDEGGTGAEAKPL
jgi:phosphatidylserine synthase